MEEPKKESEFANVLVVDDDKANRMLMKKLIETFFYASVTTVTNPKEAFEALTKISPKLIILDMQMPVMDGYTALKHIRSFDATKDTPVIAYTALGNTELLAELVKWNISDFIKKPTTTEIIVKKVSPFLPLKRDVVNE